ncbi:hypothetical protein [Paenibacillus amylolyticus]|uniref:Uncharacterized protein n=1 Tax=Paenibacillus amylolyticus TaxID=1451 RepID=A0ABD8B2R5_PAEAM
MRKYENVPGYSLLTEEQKQLLKETNRRHQRAWESEKKKAEHSVEQMKKVEWDRQEKCLKVYYEKDWYHYSLDGSWY